MKFSPVILAVVMSAMIAPSAMAKGSPVVHKPAARAGKKAGENQLRRISGKIAKKAPKAPKPNVQE